MNEQQAALKRAASMAGKQKLSAVPQSQPGERAYYSEVYHKHAAKCLVSKEREKVTKELVWAGQAVFGVNNFGSHNFCYNERFQTLLQVSLTNMQRAESWEARKEAVREFNEEVMPLCEQAVYAISKFFKNKVPVPKNFVQIESSDSYIVTDVGVFIHVWKSALEAKYFVEGYARALEAMMQLRIESIGVPYTSLFLIHTYSVTCTPVIALRDEFPHNIEGSLISNLIDQLEVWTRSRTPIELYSGVDGRFYIMDPVGVLHNHGESNGEYNNLVRMSIFQVHPQLDPSPLAFAQLMEKFQEKVIAELLQNIEAKGTLVEGVENVKIQDIVISRVIPDTLHHFSCSISDLHSFLVHPKLKGEAQAKQVLRETITAEMVCRTMKEILRAELISLTLVPEGTTTHAGLFLTEVLNRAIFNLLVKNEMWDNHFLEVLRTKFRTPASFTIAQVAVPKRVIISYLQARLGTIFEQGKFSKITAVIVRNTYPKPDIITKMVMQGKRNDAHQALIASWKKMADIESPNLQICAMVHQVVQFAIARSPSLDWYIQLLVKKLEQLDDPVVQTAIESVILDCLFELPESDKFEAALDKYLKKRLPEVKERDDQPWKAERLRTIGLMRAILEKTKEHESFGKLVTEGSHIAKRVHNRHQRLMTDVNVTMICESMYYLSNQPGTHDELMELSQQLIPLATTKERKLQVCGCMQRVCANLLTVPYKLTKEAYEVYKNLALDNLDIHSKVFADTDTKYHLAMLVSAAWWGEYFDSLGETTKDENMNMKKFREATVRIQNALISEQKNMLKGEWFVVTTGPAAQCMMEHGQWATAQHLIRFGHNVVSDGNFKSSKQVAIKQAAIPELKEATTQLYQGVHAALRFQQQFKIMRARRLENERRAREEMALRAELAKRRLELSNTEFESKNIISSSKQIHLLARKNDTRCTPPLHSVAAKRSSHKKMHALRTLLCVAHPKTNPNLMAVCANCGSFPPVKWHVTPGGSGKRHLVVLPDTQAMGSWYNQHWMVPSIFFEANTPLFAKVAASYIYSQHKYTFLQWHVIGFGFAGLIAQCLALLLPGDQIASLMTFGSPPAFDRVDTFELVPSAHVGWENDIVPNLFGTPNLARLRQRVLSRLEGYGALLLRPPTTHQLVFASKLTYFGKFFHILEGDGLANTKHRLLRAEKSERRLDLRVQHPLTTPELYNAMMIRANHERVNDWPKIFQPPFVPLVMDGLKADGTPTPTLLQAFIIPDMVEIEPIAATQELILLAYPRLALSFSQGQTRIPEEYGLEGLLPNVDLIEALEGCPTQMRLSQILGSFLGASWDPDWLALQLYEWSGAGDIRKGANSVINQQQRRTSVYAATLQSHVVEDFVEHHNFLFTVAPFNSELGGLQTGHNGGTPMFIDGINEHLRRVMQQTDGFHIGWTVGVASTVRGIGKSTLAQELVSHPVEHETLTISHRRTNKQIGSPSMRMRWQPKCKQGCMTEDEETWAKKHPVFLQINCQEIRFDGRMAGEMLLKSVAQCVWIVQDDYTFNHMTKNAMIDDDILNVIAYIPKGPSDTEVASKVKKFAVAHSFPFAIVDFERDETIINLQKMLIFWMLPNLRYPIDPLHLPHNVDVGALYVLDEGQMRSYVNRAVGPKYQKETLEEEVRKGLVLPPKKIVKVKYYIPSREELDEQLQQKIRQREDEKHRKAREEEERRQKEEEIRRKFQERQQREREEEEAQRKLQEEEEEAKKKEHGKGGKTNARIGASKAITDIVSAKKKAGKVMSMRAAARAARDMVNEEEQQEEQKKQQQQQGTPSPNEMQNDEFGLDEQQNFASPQSFGDSDNEANASSKKQRPTIRGTKLAMDASKKLTSVHRRSQNADNGQSSGPETNDEADDAGTKGQRGQHTVRGQAMAVQAANKMRRQQSNSGSQRKSLSDKHEDPSTPR